MTRWEERIRRAEQLASAHPPASEALRFYAGLAALQRSLVDAHADAIRRAATFTESLDCGIVADAMPELLSTLSRIAPAPLAAAAVEMNRERHASLRDDIESAWRERAGPNPRIPNPEQDGRRGGPSGPPGMDARPPELGAFVAEALLQPFAETIAATFRPVQPASTRFSELRRSAEARGEGGEDRPGEHRCPVCVGRPVVAVLREEAHGARRSLVCGFCLTEWRTGRIECLACGERGFEALPVFRADELSIARVDACESCRTYIKTIDLTRDATAVPIVDDIATLALDIWAREQRYQRLRPNLLRL